MFRTGIIVFPGSNCDRDIAYVLETYYSHKTDYIWHKDSIQEKYDLIVLPGGFSYGDYLRSGAIARFSNAMKSLKEHIDRGGKVLGICNGFQILTEAKLLPGTLMRNANLQHICKDIKLKIGSGTNPLTKGIPEERELVIPISHGDGCFFAEENTLKEIEDKGLVFYRYSGENPNGSLNGIAGVCSENFQIAGLMPHPERAIDPWAESLDGKIFFDSLFNFFN